MSRPRLFTITVPCPRNCFDDDGAPECRCDVSVECEQDGTYSPSTYCYPGDEPELTAHGFPASCPTTGTAYTPEERGELEERAEGRLHYHTPEWESSRD